jgi:hypothetical protein
MVMNDLHEKPNVSEDAVHLPTPTAWPLVLALGLTFALAGLVTNWGISVLGAVLIVAGCVGWFGPSCTPAGTHAVGYGWG